MAYLDERCEKLGVYEELFALKKRVERAIHEGGEKTARNSLKVGGIK
jgi:hypothetical protein